MTIIGIKEKKATKYKIEPKLNKSKQVCIYFLEYLSIIKDKVRTVIKKTHERGLGVEPG